MTAVTSARGSQRLTLPVSITLIAFTVCAWVALLLGGHLSIGAAQSGTGEHHLHHDTSRAGAIVSWALMTVAMMTPSLIPIAQSWRGRTLRRRWWATPTIAGAYYLSWIGAGVIVMAAAGTQHWSPVIVSAALLVAAAWQFTPPKKWALEAGHRSCALKLRGWRSSVSEVRCGCRHAATCMVSCWAIMAPMVMGAQPMAVLMVVGTATVTAERLSRRPRLTRRLTAVLLIFAAAVIAAPTVLDS